MHGLKVFQHRLRFHSCLWPRIWGLPMAASQSSLKGDGAQSRNQFTKYSGKTKPSTFAQLWWFQLFVHVVQIRPQGHHHCPLGAMEAETSYLWLLDKGRQFFSTDDSLKEVYRTFDICEFLKELSYKHNWAMRGDRSHTLVHFHSRFAGQISETLEYPKVWMHQAPLLSRLLCWLSVDLAYFGPQRWLNSVNI